MNPPLLRSLKRKSLPGWTFLIILPVAAVFSVPFFLLALLDSRSRRFDRDEARLVLRNYLEGLLSLSPAQLRARLDDERLHCVEVNGPSGEGYQIEVTEIADADGIRLLGGIDNGGLSAFSPLSEEVFYKKPA